MVDLYASFLHHLLELSSLTRRPRVAAVTAWSARPLPLTLVAAVPRLRAAIDALINEIPREDAHDPGQNP